MRFAVVLALPLLGCMSAAQVILKPPVVERCDAAGLRGCDGIVDGVLVYIGGDHDFGRKEIEEGAAKNAPDSVREFAAKLRALKDVPGAAQYMKPVLDVADILAPEEHVASAGAKRENPIKAAASGEPAEPGQVSKAVEAAPAARVATGGGTDLGGTVVPVASNEFACTLLTGAAFQGIAGDAVCMPLASGPAVVTDVETSHACKNVLLVGAGKPANPRWIVSSVPPGDSLQVHGAAFHVRSGETLFAAQIVPFGTEKRKDMTCSITWAAVAP